MHDNHEPSWDDIEITPIGDNADEDVIIDDNGSTKAPEDSPDDIQTGDAQDKTNVDDIIIGDDSKPAADKPAGDTDDIIIGDDTNTDKPEDKDEDKTEDDNDTSDLSGIEQYLATFDIEGGIIQFEDGTSEHFDKLDADTQKKVLDDLHASQVPDIEDEYGLDETEVNLINYCRENDLTVEQLVENMANQRVDALLANQAGISADFTTMEDDAVFMQFLKRTQPDAEIEKMEAALAEAKGTSTYKATVDTLRSQFQNEQQQKIQQQNQEDYNEQMSKIESQRASVVQAAKGLDDISGIALNDTVKNSILDKVLTINEDFDSVFVEEALGDPEQAFKTAFWYYYGEDILRQRDEYWKKEKSSAYKRGMNDALGQKGNSSERISFNGDNRQSSRSDDRHRGKTTPNKPHRTNQNNNNESWDDTFV